MGKNGVEQDKELRRKWLEPRLWTYLLSIGDDLLVNQGHLTSYQPIEMTGC